MTSLQTTRTRYGAVAVVAHTGDLAALIEQLDAAPAHLVTNSFGGELALKVALQRPELVASLSMHEPTSSPSSVRNVRRCWSSSKSMWAPRWPN